MIIKSEEGHVLTHLGLGDQVTCNGLVRELYKKHPKLYVYSKLKYFYTVEFMYRDLNNLTVLPMEEIGAYNFVTYYGISNFYKIGLLPGTTVEKGFYQQAGVEFDKKWGSFRVDRDAGREQQMFDHFNLVPKKYIFFHDDIERNQIINSDKVEDKSLPIFRARPEHTNNIFDFCKIIENAREIHVIESCFMFMIDLMFKDALNMPNLFIHRYTKPIQPFEYPTNKLDWKLYE
jgi:hypothetical protein